MRTFDEAEVVRLYVEEGWTLRMVSDKLATNHHTIKRILVRNGVPVVRKWFPRAYTDEHRRKISETSKGRTSWCKGLKLSNEACKKNMLAKWKSKMSLDAYTDYPRLKFLTRYFYGKESKLGCDDDSRRRFLDRFYFDTAFNAVYDAWIASGKDKWHRPSLDHKTPVSKGGSFDLDNLQFISWFENRAKCDMDQAEWDNFKERTGTTSDLFI